MAGGREHSLLELLGVLECIIGAAVPPRHVEWRPGDVRHSRADASAAEADLGWATKMTFDEGLARAVAWSARHNPAVAVGVAALGGPPGHQSAWSRGENERMASGGQIVPVAVARWLWLITLGSVAWIAAWGLDVAHRDRPLSWARGIDGTLHQVSGPLRHVARQFSNLGRPDSPDRFVVIAVVVVTVCVVGRSRAALIASAISLVGQLILVEVIVKPIVDTRMGVPGDSLSYPSGTTATATCLGTLVVLLIGRSAGPLHLRMPRKLRWCLALLGVLAAATVSVSVIVVGAHTVTDVIGAVPLGVTLTLLVGVCVDRAGDLIKARQRTPAEKQSTVGALGHPEPSPTADQ